MRYRRIALLVSGLACLLASAAPTPAAAAFGPTSSFGEAGTGAGQATNPGGGRHAPNGDFYLADYGNNRIDVFSPAGAFLYAFGKEVNVADGSDVCTAASGCRAGIPGTGAGALNEPEDLEIHDGAVYVADRGNNRIDEFTAAGAFVVAFGSKVNETDGSDICDASSGCAKGSSTGGEASLNEPTGITFNKTDLFVADYGNNRVDVFLPDGTFEGAFGKEVAVTGGNICAPKLTTPCQAGEGGTEAGALNSPYGIAATPGDGLAVTEEGSRRVDVFSYFGQFERAFGAGVDPAGGSVCTEETGCVEGSAAAQAGALPEPTAIAVDGEGDYYVADDTLNRISEFDPNGAFIRAFGAGVLDGADAFQVCATSCLEGRESTVPGATPHPYGLAFDGEGRLAVVEESKPGSEFARVELFGELPPEPEEPEEPGSPTSPSTSTAPSSTSKPAAPAVVENGFGIRKIRLNRKTGAATVVVAAASSGDFEATGKDVHRSSAQAAGAGGAVRLKVRAIGEARSKLVTNGKVKVSVAITFTPAGGSPLTKQKRLVLRKKFG